MTQTLANDICSAKFSSAASSTVVAARPRSAALSSAIAKCGDVSDVVALCIELRSLQAERMMLKCARDNLESVAALTPSKETDFQNRFDSLTDLTIDLAERAATQKARTLAELSAKAAFVLELAEPSEDDPLEKLLWGLAVDIIAYSAEHSLDSRQMPGAQQD